MRPLALNDALPLSLGRLVRRGPGMRDEVRKAEAEVRLGIEQLKEKAVRAGPVRWVDNLKGEGIRGADLRHPAFATDYVRALQEKADKARVEGMGKEPGSVSVTVVNESKKEVTVLGSIAAAMATISAGYAKRMMTAEAYRPTLNEALRFADQGSETGWGSRFIIALRQRGLALLVSGNGVKHDSLRYPNGFPHSAPRPPAGAMHAWPIESLIVWADRGGDFAAPPYADGGPVFSQEQTYALEILRGRS